ncbi:MAG: hypothetical protein A3C03_01045 [Candidatus Colwellbacteria bacterium RIFCSPHIGHO2_02_FULL_45_17]|uniref:DUF4258 domain-containing protein n=2 Tax=Candidatus Colwelliibacteriota TaxID=1817904 RepID=A0A1G1ZF21_9BACT|nr:MAG: hypothetical protein A3C03_01045 [Candidatus Colwellbacteria bacterium RIFCSPHIGHO2_02_FULL_45_17]OGY62560.1 MAG: hypothetical protein A3G58_00185 [Candidatus Colwellbacteria bacterium RIFCSPLOWO2_12_FULL_46_17]
MKKLYWTNHSQAKMRYYRLSEQRVKRVIRNPFRVEEGIAEDTIAVMQPFGNKKDREIWVMVADTKEKRRVISAWIYPGRTRAGDPLPDEIIREFREAL